MVTMTDIRRIRLGSLVRPAEETGTGQPRVEVVLGYVVRADQRVLLLDTGIGDAGAETDEWYRPSRVELPAALATAGLHLDDVDLVVNCHLHFDHCGGNGLLAGTPVLAQRIELETVRRVPDFTVPELVEVPGAVWEVLDGEAEPLPGVLVIPTPGHTDGHQSVVVRCSDGTVVLAGQSHDRASDFAADALALEARRTGVAEPLPLTPAWLERLLDLDPRRVLFAHDQSVWEPT